MNSIQALGVLPKRPFNHRVLLVEDSAETETIIRRICEEVDGDMRLNCVTTAEKARELLATGPEYDLIIADHFLAGRETGLDLWKTCREHYNSIPFVITSSLETDLLFKMVDQKRNFPLFMPKPFYKKDCQQVIEWYLNKKDMKRKSSSAFMDRFYRWAALILLTFLMPSVQKVLVEVLLPISIQLPSMLE